MRKYLIHTIFICFLFQLLLVSCQRDTGRAATSAPKKMLVVTTLFPVYDFVKNIAGEKAETILLLPPGTEPHSFEPRPGDLMTINRADLLFYTNPAMEPWIASIVKGTDNQKLAVINTGAGAGDSEESDDTHMNVAGTALKHDHGHKTRDPHIWLDFKKAAVMTGNIRDGLISKDPDSAEYYRRNAEAYITRLQELDRRYNDALSVCDKKVIVSGGHGSFRYLAERYHMKYLSAYGLSPDSEPSPRNLADAADTIKKYGLKHIFFEELISPRIAETIAKETGAGLLLLHGGHNISRDDLAKGAAFISLMETNLENILTGLQCRK